MDNQCARIELLEARQFLSAAVATAVTPATATIQGTVFNDRNANGLQNAGEASIANVKVFLDPSHSGVYAKGDPFTLTNSTGAYTFANLKPGAYVFSTVPPAGFQQDYPFAGAENSVTVAAGRTYTGYRFGETTTAYVAGYVKAPGINGGISGVGGATLVITAANGKGPVYTVTTNSSGYYGVGDLANTSYKITLKLPSVYVLASGSITQTTPVLGSGQSDNHVNFSLNPLVSFGPSKRFVTGSYFIDPSVFPNSGYPPVTGTGSAFSTFNGNAVAARDTGKFIYKGQEDDIYVLADAQQTSALTPIQITDSGEVTTINGADAGGGSTHEQGESFFQTTFTLKTAQHYTLSATYKSLGGEPITTGKLSFTSQGGKMIASGNGNQSTPINVAQSGTLAAGTYTLTFDVNCSASDLQNAQAAYGLALKFG